MMLPAIPTILLCLGFSVFFASIGYRMGFHSGALAFREFVKEQIAIVRKVKEAQEDDSKA